MEGGAAVEEGREAGQYVDELAWEVEYGPSWARATRTTVPWLRAGDHGERSWTVNS